MTARELIEEGVDVERGAANVAKILHQAVGNPPIMKPLPQEEPAKPARKRRSDAGKPKAKKQEAPAGVLTVEQVDKLEELVAKLVLARADYDKAVIASTDANAAYYQYISKLRGEDL